MHTFSYSNINDQIPSYYLKFSLFEMFAKGAQFFMPLVFERYRIIK